MQVITYDTIFHLRGGRSVVITSPVPAPDWIRAARGDELGEGDVQLEPFLRNFRRTGDMLWNGHVGINLADLVYAVPFIKDQDLERDGALEWLGGWTDGETFDPKVVTLFPNDRLETTLLEINVPIYGPGRDALERHPFRMEHTDGALVGIQGTLINTEFFSQIIVSAVSAADWSNFRGFAETRGF